MVFNSKWRQKTYRTCDDMTPKLRQLIINANFYFLFSSFLFPYHLESCGRINFYLLLKASSLWSSFNLFIVVKFWQLVTGLDADVFSTCLLRSDAFFFLRAPKFVEKPFSGTVILHAKRAEIRASQVSADCELFSTFRRSLVVRLSAQKTW